MQQPESTPRTRNQPPDSQAAGNPASTQHPHAPPAEPPSRDPTVRILILTIATAACLTPWIAPAVALTIGIALALTHLAVAQQRAARIAKWLIQISVVLLGLRLNLAQLASLGGTGLLFAAATIVGVFAIAIPLGRALTVDSRVTLLISAGTAICGGSAIMAVAAAIRANAAQIAVAIGSVFLLNAAALYLFPPLGNALQLSASEFGAWAGVAVHDMSSVVGAAAAYDRLLDIPATAAAETSALQSATVVKLSRVLWIVPITLLAALWTHHAAGRDPDDRAAPSLLGKLRRPVPWFIIAFLIASALRSVLPDAGDHGAVIAAGVGWATFAAKRMMTAALLLIGTGLSLRALKDVGWRPVALALVLWLTISAAGLTAARLM